MSDSNDLDKDLADMYAMMDEAEQGQDPHEASTAGDIGSGVPQAGEAEAGQQMNIKPETQEALQAGQAEEDDTSPEEGQATAGANDNDAASDDGFKPSGRMVPVERFTEIRRSGRKLEKAKHALEKQLAEAQAENAQFKQRFKYAEQTGAEVPDIPDSIDIEGVRDGDPDALADAVVYIQNNLESLRDNAAGSPAHYQQVDGDTHGGYAPEPQPESWDQFIHSLPEDSVVHELDGWMSSGDPVLRKSAQQAEQQLLNDPQFAGKDRESLYIEVVNRVKAGFSQQVEQQFQQAEQAPSQARSLSQTAGQGGGALSLVDQFAQADDPEAFMAKLSESQQGQLWASLSLG